MKHNPAYHVLMSAFMILSVLGAYAVDQLLQRTPMASWSWLIGLPSVLGIFVLLDRKLFGTFLWALPIMRWSGIVAIPDLRGRWQGTFVSSYDQKQAPCTFEIEQTAYDILVWAYFAKSSSSPVVAGFTTIHNRQYLFFTYDNDTNPIAEEGMHPHKGTARLEYFDGELRGSYFNDRGNHGTIVMRRTSKALKHRFSD